MSAYKVTDGNIVIDLSDLIRDLPDEQLNEIADFISWDRILDRLDSHLIGESNFWSSGGGLRGGYHIREHIENVQGTKDERVKDLEERIRYLEHQVANYSNYYDWYWRWYHSPLVSESNKEYYLRMVGEPTKQQPETELETAS